MGMSSSMLFLKGKPHTTRHSFPPLLTNLLSPFTPPSINHGLADDGHLQP